MTENIVRFRIAHISTVHHAEDTRIFEKECRGLVQKGHDVTLVINAEQSGIKDGVRILALPPTSGRLIRMTVGTFRAIRLALSKRADIYHLHDPELLLLGLALRLSGHDVVYDMHENVPEQIRTKQWIPSFLRGLLAYAMHFFERLTLGNMSVVMAEHSYADCYRWIKHKEVVLNLPKVEELIKLGLGTRKPAMVGYVGAVSRERGILTIIKAIRGLRAEGLPVEFQCIGNIADEVGNDPFYQQGFRDGWIRSPGRLPPRAAWPKIASCQVGLAVLKPVGNYVGSYPTKMFEYMAMGLPVIVSDFPLYRDIVEFHQCGICVDPQDTAAIAEAIRFFIENPEYALKMGSNGQKAVLQHYNWATEQRKLHDFYQSVIGEKF